MRRLVSPILLVAVAAIACDQDTPLGMQHPFQAATPQDVPLAPSADTYLRQGEPNQNQGTETILRVRNSGNNRALLRWDPAAVTQAIGAGTLTAARIELAITGNGDNWGTNGRTINLHRMTTAWTESGATWNCAVDAYVTNQRDDCSGATAWEMGNPSSANPWVATPTATQTIRNQQTGTVTFDVTADVAAMATGGGAQFGWIIKKTDEGANGLVDFGSKEGTSGPRLVLTVQAPAATQTLVVIADSGIVASPGAFETTFPTGAAASYTFASKPGYGAVTVFLDNGIVVPASGTIVMDTTHVLLASAERIYPLVPGTEPLLASARTLLTAPDPVTAFQDHIDQVMAYARVTDPTLFGNALTAIYQQAFDPVQDSAALDRLDAALANHTFHITQGSDGVNLANMVAEGTASSDDAEPTTYVYINGIGTTETQMKYTYQLLNGLVRSLGELNTPRAAVDWYYNPTRGVQTLPEEAKRGECLASASQHTGLLDFGGFKLKYDACMGQDHFSSESDLTEAVRQWFEVKNSSTVLEDDAILFADRITQYREAGSHVIVVAHSQGNLMTQQALVKLQERGTLLPNDSTFLGVVALAAPTSDGWLLDEYHLRPERVRGDLVTDLGGNHWEQTNTPLSIERDRVLAQYSWLTQPDIRAALTFYWGFERLHSVDESYFGQSFMNVKIGADLIKLYREATVGAVQCAFEGETVYPGRGRGLAKYVTVVNRNGRPLHGRTLQWSSSNEAVASVSNSGDVATHTPGTAVITVQSWQASCHFTYTVIPEPDLTGTWVGQWQRSDFYGPRDSGAVTLTITQNGIYVNGDVSYTYGGAGYGPYPIDGGILTSQVGFDPTIQFSFVAPEYPPTGGYYTLNMALTLRGGILSGGGNVTYFGIPTGVTRSWILHKVVP